MKENAKKIALWTAAVTGTALFAALIYDKAPVEVREKAKEKVNELKGKVGNVLKSFSLTS